MILLKFFTGLFTGRTVEKSLDLISEKIEDVDKRNEAIVRIVEADAAIASKSTVPIIDGFYKMGRQLMAFSIFGFYVYAKMHDIEVDWKEFLTVTGPTGLYILMKGKG